MKKRKITAGHITIFLSIILVVFFMVQYMGYSVMKNDYMKNNALDRFKQLHHIVLDSIDMEHNTINAQLSNSFALMSNMDGLILYSSFYFPENTNFLTKLNYQSFSVSYSYNNFRSSINNNEPALTRFYLSEKETDYYLYASQIPNSDRLLLIMSPAVNVDGILTTFTNSASQFIISMMLIVVIMAVWMYVVHILDANNIKKNQQLLASERRRYRVALESNRNLIWEYFLVTDQMEWDKANTAIDVNLDLSGTNRKELINNNIIHPDDHMAFFAFCDSMMTSEPNILVELRAKNRNGEYSWYRLSGTKTFDTDGYPISIIGQTSNINQQKVEYEQLVEQAAQDSLTKLYNYATFTEKCITRITSMDEPSILALMVIDVDNFTDLNDTYGYVFADAVLIEIAGRLKKLFSDSCILGRYGADEFVVLINDVPSMSYVVDTAQNILNSFQNVFTNTKTDYAISCCIGVSIYPVDANDYELLFSKADIALYDAKRRGRGCYSIYNSSMSAIPEADYYRKKNKQNQLSASAFEKRTVIDSTIIANAIDILFDSRDINVSIKMMLALIGIYYNLDHLFIIELSEDSERFYVSHEWFADKRYALSEEMKSSRKDRRHLFRGYESQTDGVYSCDDIDSSVNVVEIRGDEALTDVKSLIQCGIHYQDGYLGFINICNVEHGRVWSRSEIDSLTLLSKLIGSYLLHLYSQEKITYVSQMDALTNTYNFNAFLERTNQIFTLNIDKKYAVIYSDIYQFKLINDTFGYRSGDLILTTIASILQTSGGESALIARITGDKFVALYPYDTLDELTERVKNVVYESKRIRQTNGDFYRIILMIGIYPVETGDSAISAVDRANIARKNVVDYHLCNYMFYNESMHNFLVEQREIEDSMEEALKNHEFVVYYQPKLDIVHRNVIGAEALVRWKRPDAGLVPPIRFIPLFEDNGFIVPLDYYILDSVCSMLHTRLSAGEKVLPISVNFSRVHFSSNMLPTVLKATLEKYEIPPHLIEVEITESALAASDNYQLSILNEIHSIGCRLSMDDFGSGMSSLNILRDLPFDVLKIDKDFLHSKATSTRERIVITNVVRMAFDLDMDVICEGVETIEQEHFLKRIGCFYAQGFLYAEPMPENVFISTYL